MTIPASFSSMKTPASTRHRRAASDGPGLWTALLVGLLLLLLAAAARAENGAQATRTERFHATLPPGGTLRIENVWGDIVATPGREPSVVVTIVARAATGSGAKDLLASTTVEQAQRENEYTLRTVWPHSWHRRREPHCRDCRITAQYEVKVPPGVRAVLHTVMGDVRVNDAEGDLEIQTVNGSVVARGARKAVAAQSVNGSVDVALQSLPSSASVDVKTVNGAVLLTLPKESRFELSASSMNGTIASTFPLPSRPEVEPEASAPRQSPMPPRPPKPPRAPHAPVVEGEEEGVLGIDLRELEKEVEASMRDAEAEMREAGRAIGRLKLMMPGNQYSGSIGQGGARVRLSTLNGPITVLAAGTKESEARTLASPRRSFTVEVPHEHVAPARVAAPVHRAILSVAPELAQGQDVVRGDVSGDFLATVCGGSYRIGNIGGRVRILTQAGEIHVGSAGGGAELKTSGGDISIGSVRGDLKAATRAGDVRVGAITGSASVETSGGDIEIQRAGGFADLKTDGGDIVLKAAVGGVQARTGGGDVRLVVVSREPRGGIAIHNAGGDVTLTLPSDGRADLDLDVADCGDAGETFIRSDFPEISVLRRADSAHGSGAVNGGGPRVTVRTSSGTIRIRKGPPSGG